MDMSMKSTSTHSDLQLLEAFGRCRRSLSLHFNNALRPLGLGVKQAPILRFLSKRGKASPAELSRDTLTDPAAMTKMVNQLLKQGLLRQGEHPTDKRRWELSLTPKGEKLAAEIEKIYRLLSEVALETLSSGEKKNFTQTLQKITQHLSKEKA